MYESKMVLAIKSNKKVLREHKDTVYLNFGSEYSLLVKNLNTVKALCNIEIDGQDVVPNGLVIEAGKEIDLERWIKNGNMNEGNKFKFIERTGAIEQHRGVKMEDGLVRMRFKFEKVYQPFIYNGWPTQEYYGTPNWSGGILRGAQWTNTSGGGRGSSMGSVSCNSVKGISSNTITGSAAGAFNAEVASEPLTDTGITVPGSKSDQKFVQASWFATEDQEHVLILRLLGKTKDNQRIQHPVTVKAKQKCTSCGHLNKSHANFCIKCGTALQIYA